MIKLILAIFMSIISIFMFFLKHPLSMGLMIIIQTLLICLISGLYIYTYWFSYILFLTFSGGLLVLFIYVSSIASNELFSMFPKKSILILTFMFLTIMLSLVIFSDIKFLNLVYDSFNLNNFDTYLIFINNDNNINLTKLYNEQTYFLMILMIIYLFITLIAVVKITNIFYGPLRSFN
uniref:NADH-ubiquinone oxidoreductase chain 6 n=1 Tax=Tagiades vajuna TaxID=2053311 RepID=A0A343C6A2_9NEOP|nr:NADH dehydrogenase subunit 6 [Tagiades litigiosa]ARJ31554.1 NADH dehydrogenase subunit 6 [Tagiades vajuna]